MLATPVTATLKRCDENRLVTATVDRSGLWEAQTPQVFSRQLLTEAFAADASDTATDEAHLIQAAGHPVTVVPGSPLNLKITTRDDLRLAEQVLKVLPKPSLGGPAHPFADDDRWR
jgi:4-diphosphocytidyl-2-methyl-D-erithritol synthase